MPPARALPFALLTAAILAGASPGAALAAPVDLSVTDAGRLPQSRAPGARFALRLELRAPEARRADLPRRVTLSLYLSADAERGGDVRIGREVVPGTVLLGGRESVTASIPRATKPGRYRVFGCVGSTASESRPANNCKRAAGVLRIVVPPAGGVTPGAVTPGAPAPAPAPGPAPAPPVTPPPGPTPPPPPPPGVVLVPQAPSVALGAHHFARNVFDDPSLATEVTVRNDGATTSGPLAVTYPTDVTDNCGLGNSSPCKDLDPDPCNGATLATGEQCSMLLSFEPDQVATLDGTLIVRDRTRPDTAQTPASIHLTSSTFGGAYFSPGGFVVDVVRGDPFSVTRTVGVANIGDVLSAVPGPFVIVGGSAFVQFEKTADTCTAGLAPDADCTVTIRAYGNVPTNVAAGEVTATLKAGGGPGGTGLLRVRVD